MIVEESEFKGNIVLVLKMNNDSKWPFSFGLGKAKMILEAIEEIKAFVDKYDKPKSSSESSKPIKEVVASAPVENVENINNIEMPF